MSADDHCNQIVFALWQVLRIIGLSVDMRLDDTSTSTASTFVDAHVAANLQVNGR